MSARGSNRLPPAQRHQPYRIAGNVNREFDAWSLNARSRNETTSRESVELLLRCMENVRSCGLRLDHVRMLPLTPCTAVPVGCSGGVPSVHFWKNDRFPE